MPLEKIVVEADRTWGLWRISEDEAALVPQYPLEQIPESFTNPTKRLEWLCGRILVKALTEKMGYPFRGIHKDGYGKPYLTDHPFQASLSHSYPYVAAIIDKTKNVGIDLEQPKDKLLRIARRVLHRQELADAGDDVIKHCIYWCAKEALIKIHGKKDLTLADHLLISPFFRQNEGRITGRIIVENEVTTVPLYYSVQPDFVLVFNQ